MNEPQTRIERRIRRRFSSAVKCVAACATYFLLAAACQRPATTTATTESISFQPPTATEAFNLRSRCIQIGEKFIKDNLAQTVKDLKRNLADSGELEVFGATFSQEHAFNYNSKKNRCYAEIKVWFPGWTGRHKPSFSYRGVSDAQTGKLLAYTTTKEIIDKRDPNSMVTVYHKSFGYNPEVSDITGLSGELLGIKLHTEAESNMNQLMSDDDQTKR